MESRFVQLSKQETVDINHMCDLIFKARNAALSETRRGSIMFIQWHTSFYQKFCILANDLHRNNRMTTLGRVQDVISSLKSLSSKVTHEPSLTGVYWIVHNKLKKIEDRMLVYPEA